mmetsp:Transcript_7530/g.11260  ORF Transcript_7530/g.11260 Transcript_7530/m.11260 type:complete len:169 (+) Transcript_7530:124-630(+)|eukprot:CAMPEP_0171452882 /NCGR_PEP_ID=MMETSP0945-20130129/812_1 /TAXON_ID=109269 /ORGANISM="Vaucheria litorea, Strain CCMP2940" /LENGTH=168 /DNA_ID=CAMNT_0011977637 /DNA_START=75 /DNA_END=581 /DNA_ORIENTATION=+
MIRGAVVGRRFANRGMDFAKAHSKLSSAAARSELAQLRSMYEEINHKVKEASKPVEAIDWAYYKENISSNKDLVATFQKEYESMELPSYTNEVSAEAEKALNEIVSEAKGIMEASEKRAAELESLLATLESNRTDANTTVDDYASRNKEVDAEIMAEIEKEEFRKDIA